MATRKKTTRVPAPRRKPASPAALPTSKTGLVYHAVIAVMAAIQPIIKDETSPDGSFNFARMDSVTAAIRPLMIQQQILAVPHAIFEHIENVRRSASGIGIWIFTKVRIQWRIYALDGSWLQAETMGEGLSDQQHSTAAAQTMAFKTLLEKVFVLPLIQNGHPADPESSYARDLDASAVPTEGVTTAHSVSAPATAPTQAALPVADEVITPGLFGMLTNNLANHPNVAPTSVCAKFGIEIVDGNTALNAIATNLKRSQMQAAMDFITRDGKG